MAQFAVVRHSLRKTAMYSGKGLFVIENEGTYTDHV